MKYLTHLLSYVHFSAIILAIVLCTCSYVLNNLCGLLENIPIRLRSSTPYFLYSTSNSENAGVATFQKFTPYIKKKKITQSLY